MFNFIIGLLTFVLVLDCVALTLLVLVQLPKKEAGMGLAFGAGAADALFGAGSGNVLTKATKYAAAILLGLAVILSIMQSKVTRDNKAIKDINKAYQTGGIPASGGAAPVAGPQTLPAAPLTPAAPVTPAPAAPVSTPAAPAPAGAAK
jgi:preprotein translocase subunit SecG